MTVKSHGLLNRIRRAFTSSEELEDEVLAQQAQDSGACRLADCKERSRVKVRGTIRWITKEPVATWWSRGGCAPATTAP